MRKRDKKKDGRLISRKNNLDEMQEQKLLQIEHNGCWLAFWGLFLVLMLQLALSVIMEENLISVIAGEFIVFLCLAGYLGIACMRNGIWDRHIKMNRTVNVVISLIAGGFLTFFCFGITYYRVQKLISAIATGIFCGVLTFVLTFGAMACVSFATRKRQMELENEPEEDEENISD